MAPEERKEGQNTANQNNRLRLNVTTPSTIQIKGDPERKGWKKLLPTTPFLALFVSVVAASFTYW